ncbi:MAG: DUF433 domain-containing protein [Planctomycetes bacterium]|nr:DUF433 domain-containing protein [Planctomycetota bacterium]
MSRPHWRSRISIDPKVHSGDPCVKGTRVPVRVIVGSIAEGSSVHEILREYPTITREDVRAALRFAAKAVSGFDGEGGGTDPADR